MKRVIRARIGYFAGILLITLGLGWELGLGWAFTAAGVGTTAAFVWLYDVAEPTEPVQTRDEGWM